MPISNCALNSETWEFTFESSGPKTITFTRSSTGAANVGTWRDSEGLNGIWVVNARMITLNQLNPSGPVTDPFVYCGNLVSNSRMAGMVGTISNSPNPTQTFSARVSN